MPSRRRIGTGVVEAVAAQVKSLRAKQDWTQDDLAAKLREKGFPHWTRSVIAALESKNRQITLEDLIALAVVFNVPLADLIPAAPEIFQIGPRIGADLRELLSGSHPSRATVIKPTPKEAAIVDSEIREQMRQVRQIQADSKDLDVSPNILFVESRRDFEQRLARHFKMSPERLIVAAYRLWGRSATEERDQRAARGQSKAHVSRAMIHELAETRVSSRRTK